MLADEQSRCAGELHDLCAEQSEFAVADYGYAIGVFDRCAFENAAGGGEWFSEDCVFVFNVFGNGKQVDVRQLQKLGVCAIAADNSQHGAGRTMTRITGAAECASSAARVDLTDNATTDQTSVLACFDNADELMSDRSVKAGVTTRDLEIRVADARQEHTDQSLVGLVRFVDIPDC